MIRKPSLAILVCLLIVAGASVFSTTARAVSPDIRVSAADDHGVTIEMTAPPLEIKEEKGPDITYQRLRVKGWISTSREGYPELPADGVLAQVPDSGPVTVEILDNPTTSISIRDVCPAPGFALSEDGARIAHFVTDEAAYRTPGFLPGDMVEVSPRSVVRGVTVVRVMFYPFQWSPTTGELRCSRKIRVRLHFQESLPAASVADSYIPAGSPKENVFEELLKAGIAGYRGRTESSLPSQPQSQLLSVAPTQIDTLSVPTGPGVRIEVKQDGIYRLSYEDLVAAGVTQTTIRPGTFQLFNKGSEVAIRVVLKTGGVWEAGDYIELYAQGIDNTFTDTNVYWLYWNKAAGKRITTLSGKVTGLGTLQGSFYDSLHTEENHIFWASTPGVPDQDAWTWEVIRAPATMSHTVNIPAPATSAGNAVVRVCFQGYSTASPHPDHHTRVLLNATVIGDEYWDGNGEYIQEMNVPAALFKEGSNSLTIEAPCDTGARTDIVLLDWIGVDYWRRFEAVQDQLKFTVQGNGRLRMKIGKLSQSSVIIYDVTDPSAVKKITGFRVMPDGAAYKATFEDVLSGAKTYRVLCSGMVKKPEHIELWHPRKLRSLTNGADYILITARELLTSVQPLRSFRAGQGLRAKAVAVEDIYNEFSYGLADPQAIKDFLKYAYENWVRPAPTYVLLVGDSSHDYRNYLGTGKKNLVPVHLSITQTMGLTPDDNWYVAVEGNDVLPEMLIGRVSASTPVTATQVVNKIVRYEKSTAYLPRKALFVADNDDPDFQNLNEGFISLLPAAFEPRRVYLSNYANVTDATGDIVTDINQGMLLTTYVGHGNVTFWAAESLFAPSDILSLKNRDRLTFVMTLECLNGYFAMPSDYSLAEAFVIAPDRGAIAAFAPTGLGYSWENQILGNQVFTSIFKNGEALLGRITIQSKIDAYAAGASDELMTTFTLLGDPAGRLKLGN